MQKSEFNHSFFDLINHMTLTNHASVELIYRVSQKNKTGFLLHILATKYQSFNCFLAAMSSSRSDVVTNCVRVSVPFFLLVSLESVVHSF